MCRDSWRWWGIFLLYSSLCMKLAERCQLLILILWTRVKKSICAWTTPPGDSPVTFHTRGVKSPLWPEAELGRDPQLHPRHTWNSHAGESVKRHIKEALVEEVLRHWTWRKTDPRRAASPALTSRTAVILGDGVTLSFLSCSLLLALSLSPFLSKTVEPPFPQRSTWDLILS